MKRSLFLAPGLLLALGFAAAPASAATITFNNELFDGSGGIGAVPTILVLQNNGTESGAVSWNGSADVESGDAKAQSQTWTAGQLAAAGVDGVNATIGLVLNIDDTNPADDVDMTALAMTFFSPTGTTLFSAAYAGPFPKNFEESGQGVGSSGFLFRVNLTASEVTMFFADADNRIGLSSSINNADNGPEIFYLASIAPDGTPNPLGLVTPEPASLVLLGSGLIGIYAATRRRRKA